MERIKPRIRMVRNRLKVRAGMKNNELLKRCTQPNHDNRMLEDAVSIVRKRYKSFVLSNMAYLLLFDFAVFFMISGMGCNISNAASAIPLFLVIAAFFFIAMIPYGMKYVRIMKDIMAVKKGQGDMRVCPEYYVFEKEVRTRTGNDADSSMIGMLYFRNPDTKEEMCMSRYVKDCYFDQLLRGQKYKILSVNNRYVFLMRTESLFG